MGIEHSRNPQPPEGDPPKDPTGSHACNRIQRYDVNLNSAFTHDLDVLIREPELEQAIQRELQKAYKKGRELIPAVDVKKSTLNLFKRGALNYADKVLESHDYDYRNITPCIYGVSAYSLRRSGEVDRIYAAALTFYDDCGMASYVQTPYGIHPVQGEGRTLVEHIATTYPSGKKENWWYYSTFLAPKTFEQEVKNLKDFCSNFTCGDMESESCFLHDYALEELQDLFDQECQREGEERLALPELVQDMQMSNRDEGVFRLSMFDRYFLFKPKLNKNYMLSLNLVATA